MIEKNQNTVPTKSPLTLKEFVEDNDKLLTAMGVMGALAAFFATVKNGQYIAFLSVGLLFVLYIELYKGLYKIRARSDTLSLFITIATGFPVAIYIFIAQTYWENFRGYFVPLTSVAAIGLLIPRLKRKFGNKKWIIIYILIVAIFLVIYEILLFKFLL
jgi:hypothetical protein